MRNPSVQKSIQEERASPSFPVRLMTFLLDGGENVTLFKEKVMLEMERDPVFSVNDIHDLSLPEIREKTMRKIKRAAEFVTIEPLKLLKLRFEMFGLTDPGAYTRIGVHYGLFFSTIKGQATPQQFQYWVSKGALALNGVTGCFAMTELGHGSNVAGLETSATFDEASDEFIIHTPTLTATKWWIGGAAQTATHAVVFAQMIVKNKKYGVKNFVVQLRDEATFELKPGVSIGDIGAKMGRHGIDNGWIQFTYVRVPRSHMLMKYTQVTRQGQVISPPLDQLAYGALIQGRVSMIQDSANFAKKALTIAVRYASVRRQFGAKKNKPETKLLDYVIHQTSLMPLLAETFAMHFAAREVNEIYENLMQKMEKLKPNDTNLSEILENLKEVHGTSAGLKAFCTWACLNTIDQSRRSLGGHGYSAYAGLASLYNDFAVQLAWEGSNPILTLQAGRYLVSCYKSAKSGKKMPLGVDYLNRMDQLIGLKCKVGTSDAILDLEMIGEAFDLVSLNLVQKAGLDFEGFTRQGLKEDEAYEQCSESRFNAAKMHSFGYLFHRFKAAVEKAPRELEQILRSLCLLYGLYNIQENSGAFLQYEYFTPLQMQWVQEKVSELNKLIRKDAVCLVDSFNYSDFVINSPFGRYDGNVYEHYFAQVNKSHPPGKPHPYFKDVIYPLLHRELRESNALELEE